MKRILFLTFLLAFPFFGNCQDFDNLEDIVAIYNTLSYTPTQDIEKHLMNSGWKKEINVDNDGKKGIIYNYNNRSFLIISQNSILYAFYDDDKFRTMKAGLGNFNIDPNKIDSYRVKDNAIVAIYVYTNKNTSSNIEIQLQIGIANNKFFYSVYIG